MQTVLWTLVGVAYAAVPPIAWWKLTRVRGTGIAVAVPLVAGALLLVAVQHGWVVTHRADAHLVHAVLAPLVVAGGALLERARVGPFPEEWAPRVNGAIGVLGMQFALTAVLCLLYVVMGSGASVPPSSAVPALPAGLTVVREGESCGSSICSRVVVVGSTEGLSRSEILRRLDRPHETCRPNGRLLDRRPLCVGVRNDGEDVVMYVSLSDLVD
ncbi:MFS transporter [uncultured Streptomyces sp.]|uniref:MFS transporter n=1 Tax=uncultured Streptomyces sp. TaxID=174707 RepID=UPI00260C64BB|nr:MFS transporter [uncultured Streptomyces sp.]